MSRRGSSRRLLGSMPAGRSRYAFHTAPVIMHDVQHLAGGDRCSGCQEIEDLDLAVAVAEVIVVGLATAKVGGLGVGDVGPEALTKELSECLVIQWLCRSPAPP